MVIINHKYTVHVSDNDKLATCFPEWWSVVRAYDQCTGHRFIEKVVKYLYTVFFSSCTACDSCECVLDAYKIFGTSNNDPAIHRINTFSLNWPAKGTMDTDTHNNNLQYK